MNSAPDESGRRSSVGSAAAATTTANPFRRQPPPPSLHRHLQQQPQPCRQPQSQPRHSLGQQQHGWNPREMRGVQAVVPTRQHPHDHRQHHLPSQSPASSRSNDGVELLARASRRKRQARALIALALVSFAGAMVWDGFLAASGDSPLRYGAPEAGVGMKASGSTDESSRRPSAAEVRWEAERGGGVAFGREQDGSRGVVRRLAGQALATFLGDPAPAAFELEGSAGVASAVEVKKNVKQRRLAPPANRRLVTIPLVPRHRLHSRRRAELIADVQPIPAGIGLMEGEEDPMFHSGSHQRRRLLYPHEETGGVRHLAETHAEDGDQNNVYETGALYQGYGTHYADLWVGTPPQRQTVIVDTGSSMTAFPCTGCKNCGNSINPRTGKVHHTDREFIIEKSSTYEPHNCTHNPNTGRIATSCDLGSCLSDGECRVAVSYAEGSSWTAKGGRDVMYPGGPHDVALATQEERDAAGVGLGMADFNWLDFRLTFGCQTKVTGLFATQLADGIMGMDNRPGALWKQLRDHYETRDEHRKMKDNDDDDGGDFDPAQFSLCYDRQPVSNSLRSGTESGAMTIGGTDPLLHLIPMVFAENVTPKVGWFSLRINGIFLRTGGGSLNEAMPDAKYVRVDLAPDDINRGKGGGVIVDSGTTDTYLPVAIKKPFEQAWKEAMGSEYAEYHNVPVEMSVEMVKALPTFLIVFKGHVESVHKNDQPDPESAPGMVGHPAHASALTVKSFVKPTDVVVAIPPEHYMEKSRKEPGMYSPRVYFSQEYGAIGILGSNFMMGHDILFDSRSGRVGFAESHCDYSEYNTEKMRNLEGAVAPPSDTNATAGDEPEVVKEETKLDDLHASGWKRRVESVMDNKDPQLIDQI